MFMTKGATKGKKLNKIQRESELDGQGEKKRKKDGETLKRVCWYTSRVIKSLFLYTEREIFSGQNRIYRTS